MHKHPKISEAEWQVIDVLWAESPATSGEIVERLGQRSDWQPKTIKSLLGRLVKKGFVAYEEEGTRYLYRPAVGRSEVVRDESRSFLERVFRGDAASLIAHFAREVDLSDEEAASLRRILDEGSIKGNHASGDGR